MNKKPKKILILKAGAIGDTFFMLPAVDSIKKIYPGSEITWVIGKNMLPLIEKHPRLDKCVTINEKNLFSKNIFMRLSEAIKMRSGLEKRYDLILIGHRATAFAIALKGRGPVFQLSRRAPAYSGLLCRSVCVPPLSLHESLAMKELVRKGMEYLSKVNIEEIEWKWDAGYIFDDIDIDLPGDYIAVHMGGGVNVKTEFSLKAYPFMNELIKVLLERTDCNIVAVGSGEETQPEISGSRVINLVGRTSLKELVYVISKCRIFTGPDSGPLHIADSLSRGCVGIYGPTSPVSWGLLNSQGRVVRNDIPCSPCYRDDGVFSPCPNEHRCMADLPVAAVLKEINDLQNIKK